MGFVSEARAFAPSKRVASLLIVVAATVVAVVIFRSEFSFGKESAMQVTLSNDTTPRTTTEEKDSDGDRLKDWEEALWGLSPVSADSDADGIGDYQEVENRQKTVADAPAIVLSGIDPDDTPPHQQNSREKFSSLNFSLPKKQVCRSRMILLRWQDRLRFRPLILTEYIPSSQRLISI